MKRSLVLVATIVALVVICAVVFTACVPSDYNKAAEKFESAGYKVAKADSNVATAGVKLAISALVKLTGDVQAQVTAVKDGSSATITYFTEKADAKAYGEYLKNHQDEGSETVIKVSGKAVFVGDEAAYKAL